MDNSVIRIRPPHGQGGTHRCSARGPQPVTAVSATAVAVAPAAFFPRGTGLWIDYVCTVPMHIRFGQDTGLDGAVGAATTNDKLVPANTPKQEWCSSLEETHFSVIREGGADGVMYWNVSE